MPAPRALPLPALAFNDQRPVACALAWRGVGGRVAGVLAGGSAGLGDGVKGGRWGPASARGGPGVSSIPESSQCLRVVFPGPARAGAGRRLYKVS